MSESEFEKNWTLTRYFSENSNGYLTKREGGGSLRVYTIKSITETEISTYYAETTSIVDDEDTMKENENFAFAVTSYNGKCVIDYCN